MPPADLDVLLARRRFPGQAPTENGIIHDWLAARGVEFSRIDFNVRVGEGITGGGVLDVATLASQKASTQKRIDVVAFRGSEVTLVEVSERVTPGKLGQLATYRHLYLTANPEVPDVDLLALGRRTDPDTLSAFLAAGVDVFLYEV